MTDIADTIAEYQHSCVAIRHRIAELNDRIAGRRPLIPPETVRTLEQRRYILYTELDEMEEAVACLEEYLCPSSPGRAAGF